MYFASRASILDRMARKSRDFFLCFLEKLRMTQRARPPAERKLGFQPDRLRGLPSLRFHDAARCPFDETGKMPVLRATRPHAKSSQNPTNLTHRIPEQHYGVRLSISDAILFRRSSAISKLTSSRTRELYRE
jgi:hypothetical protein